MELTERIDQLLGESVKYDERKMLRLLKKDRFLQFSLDSLIQKHPGKPSAKMKKEMIKVLFNTYVLDDFGMRQAYEAS